MRTATQTRRLWKLVNLMKNDPDPENFTMAAMFHSCGTPACLLGHAKKHWPETFGMGYYYTGLEDAKRFFGITESESLYLFSAFREQDIPKFRLLDTPAIAAQRVIDVIYGGGK